MDSDSIPDLTAEPRKLSSRRPEFAEAQAPLKGFVDPLEVCTCVDTCICICTYKKHTQIYIYVLFMYVRMCLLMIFCLYMFTCLLVHVLSIPGR